ncbi:MAG: 2-oxoacid:acceptor oxidoreductase subunit alpha [Saprospiraceae bacterium]|nr:2-oxoacid:acceptor oxidoreductase subunit alpha [Saprospiraceae bacterium]MBK7811367.1 2-oxoacid:acceptor oxidoreductase subunit alpha [Saprospiraceae bacterium]MBK9631386.1 2-oxoacid:acceptor oxidoreductase subunit alpha [Saprospiraceae bacterium]
MSEQIKINDLVVRFANVNGTGSASANNIFAKAVFRMGIPVTPKNIFPSNIQGLPTWYEVRVSEKGYLGRREGVDIMVAVNAQSMKSDVRNVRSGGYFVYDSTKVLPDEYIREDLHYIGIPMIQLCVESFTDPRQHLLMKNVVYVGAMAALLNMDVEVIENIIKEQFAKKEKLIPGNIQALHLGINYAKANYDCPLPIHMESRNLCGNKILIEGNNACGLGAVYAGATVGSWYPITPSTSVMNAFEKWCYKLRIEKESSKKKFAIVQAEDELAAMGMVLGASWNGARAFTATSGPGVSLMSEFLGLSYFAEIPAVLIDVQRTGPSTGMPTRTQQSDILAAAYASHGDTKHILLFPSTPTECFELTALSFDFAERFQTAVIVMIDLDLGMNDHLCDPLVYDPKKAYDRGKVMSTEELEAGKTFGRYWDVDGDGITYRTIPGTHPTKGSFFTRGSSRDEFARYTEDGDIYARNMNRLIKKWQTAALSMPKPEIVRQKEEIKEAVLYFGTSSYSAMEAMDLLDAQGRKLNAIRILSFPFPEEVKSFIDQHDCIYVIEQNRDAQMRSVLLQELHVPTEKLKSVLQYNGMPITADYIVRCIQAEKSFIPQYEEIEIAHLVGSN